MDTFQTAQDNPSETLQTLLTYEKRPGQAQRFLGTVPRVGKNFRWPSSMPEYLRRSAFENIADVDFEFDDEVGFNLLFFYNALDSGEFSEHENEWVTVYKQRVIEYGQKYDDDKLNCILETMPGAVQIPVDQKRLPRNPPAKMVSVRVKRPREGLIALLEYDFYDIQNDKKYTCVVDTGAPQTILPFYIKRTLGRTGWSTLDARAGGYGAPARQFCASRMFEISIGDNDNWSKWVQAKIVVWEKDPGNQVEYALVGNDVTDQLAYAHEPRKSIKFLDPQDEPNLIQFLMGCA
ncbi:4513_t:CDS:2 [Ambispora leptoticha]|uniref:4513_t:CDS:1 n=1 Tax=Ambispora leptoticha TaxID=144679 RepID=A0A9N8VWH4_9GLOM|nr:4513_t:CDS:2 [Ambispora leptoticha]